VSTSPMGLYSAMRDAAAKSISAKAVMQDVSRLQFSRAACDAAVTIYEIVRAEERAARDAWDAAVRAEQSVTDAAFRASNTGGAL